MPRWLIALIMMPLLAPWAGVAPAADIGRTTDYGGRGGKPFELRCQDGYVLTGALSYADKDLDAISISCTQSKGNRLLASNEGGYRVDPGAAAGMLAGKKPFKSDFTAWQPTFCPPGMAVEGIGIQRSAVNLVHAFWLQCRDMQTYATDTTRLSGYRDRGEALASDTRNCGGGAIAIGIFGLVMPDGGAEGPVRSLGLVCKVLAQPAAPPKPAPQQEPAPGPAPLPINNDRRPALPIHKG